MNFLSIDPGKEVGIACWKNDKFVKVVKFSFDNSNFQSSNLVNLIDLISSLASEIQAEAIVTERPARSLSIQFMLYSDVRLLSKQMKIQFAAYPPKKVKKVASGDGNASKDEMTIALMMRKICSSKKIESFDEHEVDSICVGICFLEDLFSGGEKKKTKAVRRKNGKN